MFLCYLLASHTLEGGNLQIFLSKHFPFFLILSLASPLPDLPSKQYEMDIPFILRVFYILLNTYAQISICASKSHRWLHLYFALPLQAFPMLVVSVIGLILAGVLMDKFQVNKHVHK